MYIFICSSLTAILNEKLLPVAITHVRRFILSYSSVHCTFDIAASPHSMHGTAVTGKIAFFRDRKSDVGLLI